MSESWQATPSITSLSPTSGAVGAPITITGTNFGATQGSSSIRFNGIVATPASWSATRIVAPVPPGATTGMVTVTVGGLASNGVTFTVSSLPSGPITLTQRTSLSSSGTSAALPFLAPNAAGNLILVATRAYQPNQAITVSDSAGNVYKRAATLNNNTSNTVAIFYAENIRAGSNTVTVGVPTSASIRIAIFEYAGVARTNALDVTASRSGSGASPDSGTATTTAAGGLVVGVFSTGSGRTFTGGSGYTIRETVQAAPSTRLMVQDATQIAAGPVSAGATLDSSDLWGSVLVAFKKEASSTNLPPTLTQPANQTSAANATVSLALAGSDPEGAPLAYSATGLPPA